MVEELIVWIIFILYILLMIYKYRKVQRAKEKKKSPFDSWEMMTVVQCKKCDKTFERPFKRFEYFGQIIDECCGEAEIVGTYYVHKKTKKELKWEREVKKWR